MGLLGLLGGHGIFCMRLLRLICLLRGRSERFGQCKNLVCGVNKMEKRREEKRGLGHGTIWIVDGWHARVSTPGVERTSIEGVIPVSHILVQPVQPGFAG